MIDKQVTDEILSMAEKAYLKGEKGSIVYPNGMKAALEAVFASMPDDKKVIKDFVDMMEKIMKEFRNSYELATQNEYRIAQVRTAARIITSVEYQALKASISPVSEDKCKCDVNGFVDINCPKCGLKGCKQPTDTQDNQEVDYSSVALQKSQYEAQDKANDDYRDILKTCYEATDTQENKSFWPKEMEDIIDKTLDEEFPFRKLLKEDNDGWIEWNGDCRFHGCPIDESAYVEVRFKDKTTLKEYAHALKWMWTNNGKLGDIIAYRIVEEPKKQVGLAIGRYYKNPPYPERLEFIGVRNDKHLFLTDAGNLYVVHPLDFPTLEFWEQNKCK